MTAFRGANLYVIIFRTMNQLPGRCQDSLLTREQECGGYRPAGNNFGLFFPSQKKASMAWKTFSAAGGQADRAAAQVIFPYQNAPIDYNGRDEAVRAALESLRRETLADGQKL